MRGRANRRNQDIGTRINAHLSPVSIDYERDVLPLTPRGNPTERHLLAAYVQAVQRSQDDISGFWADKLDVEIEQVTDRDVIMDLGAMIAPALVVEGQLKAAGVVLSVEQIKRMLA